MKNRNGFIISALAAVVTLAATAASATTVYIPTAPAPAYGPAPRYAPPGNANVAAPIPGMVLDDRGNPLPPCRERGPNGIQVLRGAGCVP